MSTLTRAREFLLGAYHDLPNVLFIGSFLLGTLTGYLPLIWISLGLILNAAVVAFGQGILRFLTPTWSQVSVRAGSAACEILSRNLTPGQASSLTTVAPSMWLSAAAFFAVFIIFNSVQLALRPASAGASPEKVDSRRAFTLSTLVIGAAFFLLILARGFSGCETWLGGILGVLVGGGTSIGFWYLLDACGTGTIPDVLQVINNMAPSGEAANVPVLCTPSTE
jgi:hypothetical protein